MMRPLAFAAALCALAASVHAQTLDRLAETGELRIGVRADAAPLSHLRDGKPAGYTVAVCERLAERLAARLGRELTLRAVEVDATNRFDAVAEGRIDLLCGAASETISRRATVDFSIPVFIDGATVIMRRDGITDFKGLAGARIGVRAGTTTETGLRATLAKLGMEAEVVTLNDHGDGLTDLLGGVVRAYFADQSILMGLLAGSERRSELAISSDILTIEPQALALPLGDHAFRAAVDSELSHMYRSGEVAKIFEASFAPNAMGDAMKALTLTAPIPD